MTSVPLANMQVNGRHRKDLGDLKGLAESIRRHGLIQPIVLDPAGRLLAGQRRLEAAKLLGWTEIPAVVMDPADPLGVENDENAVRKALTPSELVAIGRAIEVLEAQKAKERQNEGARAGGKACGKLPQASGEKTRDAVARSLGVSGRTYEKARTVVEAAERDPERYAPFVARMNRTGRVDPAFKALAAERKREEYQRRAAEAPKSRDVEVWTGDFQEAGRHIADSSVDLILTDPPYIGEALPLWKPLAEFAVRVLKPGALLIAYTGSLYVPQCIRALEGHLTWYWQSYVYLDGSGGDPLASIYNRRIQVQIRPVLMFSRGEHKPGWWWKDFIDGGPRQAGLHPWQQSLPAFRVYTEKFTQEGDLVVDPFTGSGTTLVAAAELGRRAIGIEIDPGHADVARGRVAEVLAKKEVPDDGPAPDQTIDG